MEDSLHVLLVDDNRELSNIIKTYLSQRGFNVMVANNGRDAMGMIEKARRIDVILLDLMLPDVNGLDMLRSIREHSKDVVIIIISGVKDLNTVIEAMKAGADDYLVKPFRLGELENKINEILYKRAMEQPVQQTLTAERALEVVDTLDYSGGMLKFSFKNIDEMRRFLNILRERDDVDVKDVRVGEEYEVYLTIKR